MEIPNFNDDFHLFNSEENKINIDINMCGIGFILGKTKDAFRSYLKKLLTFQSHRGPDYQDSHVRELHNGLQVGFSHTRLSLLDLTKTGNQPMIDPVSDNVLVFNGEIYNYREIKKELIDLGENFFSSSDSEVLLIGYRRFGLRKLIKKIRGMYAFIIWDQKNKIAVAARDKFGIKPLYYTEHNNYFSCASECNALVQAKLASKEISEEGLDSFLAYGSVQSPLTIYKNIKSLLPGHAIIINSNGKLIENFDLWETIDVKKTYENNTELMFKIIKNYIFADVPVGVFLSGGFDSTLLAFLANNISKKRINTFNLKFSEFPKFSEHEQVRKISKYLNSVHHEIDIKQDDVFKILPSFFNSLDQPTDDGLNIFLLSKFVKKKGFKACLHGVGGDELFGGYPSFHQIPQILKFKFIPDLLRSVVSNYMPESSISLSKIKSLLASDLSILEIFLIRRQNFSYYHRKKILSKLPPLSFNGVSSEWVSFIEKKLCNEKSLFKKISNLELYQYCSNKLLLDCDVLSMKNGLEVRTPYLDVDTLNFYQFNQKNSKTEFVSKFRGFPNNLMSKQKTGFTLPFEKWLTNKDDDYFNYVIQNLDDKFSFNKDYLKDIFFKNKIKGKYEWLRKWQLIVLSNWAIAKL